MRPPAGTLHFGISAPTIWVIASVTTGAHPWTVIPVQRRADYMAALERASIHLDIAPFAHFIGDLVRRGMSGERTAELPAGTVRN